MSLRHHDILPLAGVRTFSVIVGALKMEQDSEKEVEEEHPRAVDSELDQSDTAGDIRLLEFLPGNRKRLTQRSNGGDDE